MNNISRILIIALLIIGFNLMAGCKTIQDTTTTRTQEPLPEPVSQLRQLESTALMVDATRQKALENWPQAASLFFEAVERNPLNDAAHFELAKIHAMQGEFADALRFAQMAVKIDPSNKYYQMVLADVYILSDQLPQAIQIYEALVGQHPDNVDYHYYLVNAYLQNKQQQSALAVLEHIESITGFVEELSIQKQKILIEMGEFDKAIVEAEKLLEIFPEEPMFYELLGELYTETGQPEKAMNIYKDLLEIEPGNPVAFLLIADYYQTTGDSLQAFDYLRQAFSSGDLGAEAKARILYSFYVLSEKDKNYLHQALELCQILVGTHPQDAEVHLIYGDFLNRSERLQEARDAFLKGAQLEPSNVNVWQQVLILDSMLQEFEAMKEHSELALEYFFEHPLLFLFNGIANIGLKNYPQAVSSLEFGLGLTASDPEMKEQFLTTLGDVYHFLDDFQKSDDYYEQALELNPDNATALNNFSFHLAERGIRLQEAEEMSRKAIELEEGNAAFYDTYGWILYRMGRYEEARYWIEKSIDIYSGESGTVLEHYGDVLYKLGNKEQALIYWNKAVEAGEGSPLLDRKVKNQTLYE